MFLLYLILSTLGVQACTTSTDCRSTDAATFVCVDKQCRQQCGGFAGLTCPDELQCQDVPNDDCDPRNGGADCPGFCAAAPPVCNFVDVGCPRDLQCKPDNVAECDPAVVDGPCPGTCVPFRCNFGDVHCPFRDLRCVADDPANCEKSSTCPGTCRHIPCGDDANTMTSSTSSCPDGLTCDLKTSVCVMEFSCGTDFGCPEGQQCNAELQRCEPQACGTGYPACPEFFSCQIDPLVRCSSLSDCPMVCLRASSTCESCGKCAVCNDSNECQYEPGKVFKHSDGCNTCTCGDSPDVAPSCTEMACNPDPTCDNCGPCHLCQDSGSCAFQAGFTFTARDGCNVCTCGAKEGDSTICTDRNCANTCQEQSDCSVCHRCHNGICEPRDHFFTMECNECYCRGGEKFCTDRVCEQTCTTNTDCGNRCFRCDAGGCLFREGHSFTEDECTLCECRAGGLHCYKNPACSPSTVECDQDCGPCARCTVDGCVHMAGHQFRPDACNTCTCGATADEGPTCTRMACESTECSSGTTFLDADRCSTCKCSADSEVVCTREECTSTTECPQVRCALHCDFGYLQDRNGCKICECRPRASVCDEVRCPEVLCAEGFAPVVLAGSCCATCEPKPDDKEPACSKTVLLKKAGPRPDGVRDLFIALEDTACDAALDRELALLDALAKDAQRSVLFRPVARCCSRNYLAVLIWVYPDPAIEDEKLATEDLEAALRNVDDASKDVNSALKQTLNVNAENLVVDPSEASAGTKGGLDTTQKLLIGIGAILVILGSLYGLHRMSKKRSDSNQASNAQVEGSGEGIRMDEFASNPSTTN